VREMTGEERQTVTSEAAKAAAVFLKAVKDPEGDPSVVGCRTAVERLAGELQAAQEAATGADRVGTEARAHLHEALASGKSTARAWEAITDGERSAAEARIRFELTKQAAGEANAVLATARLATIEAVLPAARQAVHAATEAARAAEVAFLAGARALAMVRSRVGSLASQADHLRTAAAGDAR